MVSERLRLYVGVALIVFFIITANIIIWGMAENKLLADIEKRQCIVTVENITRTYNITSEMNVTTQTQSNPVNTSPTNPVNSGVTTRAS